MPVTGSVAVTQASSLKPTLKLEVFEPTPEPQKPYGIYTPYVPKIDIPGVPKKFSPSAFQNLFAPTSALSYGPNIKMPVQQVYNITLPGPTGSHVEMNKIYENILPGKENKLTSTTIGERIQTYDYVRQILIKINDGEDISIDSNGYHNLMSYIKVMELNPNYYSPIHTNPYQGLPFGLLIYRSCFPIKMENYSQSIICAKDSIGLNIRLYALTYAEYYSYKFRQIVYKEYDVWRELSYYEYVRENIIKKKQSPNFAVLYAFFLSPNQTIDFFSLRKNCLTQKDMLSQEYQQLVRVHNLFSSVKPSNEIIRPMTLPDAARKIIAKLPDEMDPSLQAYSGMILILITEAPHHNMYQWMSRIYERDGIVRKMISHGFHDEKVWLGILFQIVSALYVMQLHGIYMRCMTIEDNIYIKDLQQYGKGMGYWKYVINSIPFYVPNYGYIVMVDSNFKDIVPPGQTIERCKREYKIYTSRIIGKNYTMDSIQRKVFENYRKIINTNSFTKEHTQNNVNRPPESIMKLIERMMDDKETDLGKVIVNHFHPLLNNRIGTLLKKDEIPNIREITGQFKNGEIVVQVIEEQLFKFCQIIGPDETSIGSGIMKIITKDSPDSTNFIEIKVRIETLKQYSSSEKIEQNTTPDVIYNDDQLLETYIIS
ncbi:MAG: hypothetical protein Satyrvirus2_36 [Satyrvirus sp.]|uniref:Uncharacterized protein n=1 Tax=Satyrvirus sp. TaxID=2487771 RepID=A0A3G5ACR8_9VIRU|nr:MAG: hypothetical protein Satyrvirus2_36 [Satyrvirus sp.]